MPPESASQYQAYPITYCHVIVMLVVLLDLLILHFVVLVRN